jgi:hypothetical protein
MKALLAGVILLALNTTAMAADVRLCTTDGVTRLVAGQQQGCCSWHGGVCGCSGGHTQCCDGTQSPSCRC